MDILSAEREVELLGKQKAATPNVKIDIRTDEGLLCILVVTRTAKIV